MAAAWARNLQLYVGRVAWTIGQKELKEYFNQFGPVRKIRLPWTKETGFHRQWAIVTMRTEEGMNNALGRDTHLLEGSKMLVQRKQMNTAESFRTRSENSLE